MDDLLPMNVGVKTQGVAPFGKQRWGWGRGDGGRRGGRGEGAEGKETRGGSRTDRGKKSMLCWRLLALPIEGPREHVPFPASVASPLMSFAHCVCPVQAFRLDEPQLKVTEPQLVVVTERTTSKLFGRKADVTREARVATENIEVARSLLGEVHRAEPRCAPRARTTPCDILLL